ncbi:MAG: metal ABC transporter substrate-binding protein [Nocardioides sp.]
MMPARPGSRVLGALAVLGASGLLAGCGAISDEGTDGRRIVASFYPLAWVTEQVAGDEWTVTNLTAPGGEPHDLSLTIEATAELAESDLVVYLHGFQPAVDDAIDANASGATLDAAEVVDLLPLGEHEHAGEDTHDHGEEDPHFWQDPERMALLTEAVGEELATLDEAGADGYRDRASDLAQELRTLDREYAEGLSDCRRDVVVVSHDAFGYLERYGVHLAPIAGLSPDAEPTPAVLGELSELIRAEGLTTVFSERLASQALADTLATDLGIRTAVLDPIEGLTDETADDDYLSLMRQNLAALQEANGC